MNTIVPQKLRPGDHIRVISPSRSLSLIHQESRDIAIDKLQQIGLRISYSKNVEESDEFVSSSIASRLEDLHEAFRDPDVNGILTTIGGWNANQILPGIDFELIRQNPKVICGYSDITVLLSAIYSQTGMITYYGPHFSTFGALKGNEYTHAYFRKCTMDSSSFSPEPSRHWSEDAWFMNQESRDFKENPGWEVFSEGEGSGTLIGGHLGTFTLLQGTVNRPSAEKVILFFEEDESNESSLELEFDRCLESVLQQSDLGQVVGLVLGRLRGFVNKDQIRTIVQRKPQLKGIPVVYGVDFGHTMPMMTIPIGGTASLIAKDGKAQFSIEVH